MARVESRADRRSKNPKSEIRNPKLGEGAFLRISDFGFRISVVIRHSSFVIRHSFVLALIFAVAAAQAAGDAEQSAAKLVTPPARRAVERGLKWLADGQHDDGSFGTGMYRGNVAVTALCGMAMMCGGSTP
ncbi:MAG: hypothetical protein ABFC96_05375, partial [Thermoguttaceae bacterium]